MKNTHNTRQEIYLGLSAAIVSFITFIYLKSEISSPFVSMLDKNISFFVYSFRTSTLTLIMRFFSFVGVEVTLALFLLFIVFLLKKHAKRDISLLIGTLILGGVVDIILKQIIQRPRPSFAPLITISNDFSFPSGHAMNSFLFYTTTAYLVFHITRSRRAGIFISGISTVLVLCVGISRIYLGVHYPSDVVAGYIAGLGWFCVVLSLEKAFLLSPIAQRKRVKKE